jgi:hypothetical protein
MEVIEHGVDQFATKKKRARTVLYKKLKELLDEEGYVICTICLYRFKIEKDKIVCRVLEFSKGLSKSRVYAYPPDCPKCKFPYDISEAKRRLKRRGEIEEITKNIFKGAFTNSQKEAARKKLYVALQKRGFAICKKCGCKFKFTKDEVLTRIGSISGMLSWLEPYVLCPTCKAEID